MNKKIPLSFPMYDTVYGNEIPLEQYFVIVFDTLPSKYVTSTNYDPEINEYFKSIGFIEETNVFSTNRRMDYLSQSLYVNKEKRIMIKITGSIDKSKNNLLQIDINYDLYLGKIENQLDLVKLKEFERPKKKCSINLVKSEHGHLDVEEYDLFVQPMDLELNYGKNFTKIHDVIINRLNKENDKGIILLHGDPGTGKCVTGNTKIKVRNKKTGEINEINIDDLM